MFLLSAALFDKKLSFLYQAVVLNLHSKNISLIVDFLFLFKLKTIPNHCSRRVSIRFLELIESYPIRLVSLSGSERSNPSHSINIASLDLLIHYPLVHYDFVWQSYDVLYERNYFTKGTAQELLLTQISLNLKTSCCNVKIRGQGAKLCVAFLLF